MKNASICCLAVLLGCGLAMGQATEKVLWTFVGGAPDGNLVFDSAGNLYGTNSNDGAFNGGIVFELSPQPDGSWSETTLYNFCSQGGNLCSDGSSPQAGLAIDAKGNLYGTTLAGGLPCQIDFTANTCGTVFEMSPPSVPGGAWTHEVLYRFCTVTQGERCLDGAYPGGPLVFDASGNLYGEGLAAGGGHYSFGFDAGVVFELSPRSGGWKQKVLYNFCSLGKGEICPDGAAPWGGVIFDKAGNMYGTASSGGDPKGIGGGAVFKLAPNGNGWKETVLMAFPVTGQAPDCPQGGVIIDSKGFLYGTITNNGRFNSGGVFRLPSTGGKPSYFWFDGTDGSNPATGLLIDSKRGVLYGTTPAGGANSFGFGGTVFAISAAGKETVVYSFCSLPNCADGQQPEGSLIEDKAGNLYGTTYLAGTVYEITP